MEKSEPQWHVPQHQKRENAYAGDDQRGDAVHFPQGGFGKTQIEQPVKIQQHKGNGEEDRQYKQVLVVVECFHKPSVQKGIDKMGATAGDAFSA